MTNTSSRSTINQFIRVLWRERPSFIFVFSFHVARFIAYKYLLGDKELTRNIHGNVMSLSLNDSGISRSLLLVGDREREHRYMLERVMQPGCTVLDLGANLGYYVLMELKLMQNNGHVIAVEPATANFRRLQQNLHLNDLADKVTAIHAAVTDQDGKVRLNLSRLSNVHSLLPINDKTGTGLSQAVDAISLASLVKRFPNINLIRMDIEGYEQTILSSLIHINQTVQFSPNILFELHSSVYDNEKFIRTLAGLEQLGYRVKFLASANLGLLKQNNCQIIAAIKTDGAIRHIAQDVPMNSFIKFYPACRAVLLTHS